jgi:hypothetical protein
MPHASRLSVSILLSTLAGLTLAAATGCGSAPHATVEPAAVLRLSGRVHGGQQPVGQATVTLYAANITTTAGSTLPTIGTPVTTATDGSFSLTGTFTCPSNTATPVYLVATGGNPGLTAGTSNGALTLMAALGPCSALASTPFVNVNEITTAAAAFALGNFMTDATHVGAASINSITLAFSLANELVSTASGVSPGSVPAGSFAPSEKINTLGNILASCVNSDGSGATGNSTLCGQLFTDTTYTGTRPTNTLNAAINIAAYPASSPSTIFALGSSSTPFQPALASAPTSWTVPIASVTWATPGAIVYGTALSSTQLDASSNVGGSFSYSPAASTVLSAGVQTLSTTFTPTDTADYPNIPASVSLTVTQATPAITWNTPSAITAGTALSSTQLNASTPVNGSFAYTPAAGTLLNDGSHTLSTTFTPSDTADYTTATKSVSITVNNATPNYTFKNVQIVAGGFVTGVVAHPTQQNLRYARTDIGGAYRWNQTSGTWIPLLDYITRANANLGGVESIALDPNDPTRLYLAVGEYTESFGSNGAFLLSADQGATFTQVNASFKMGSNDAGRNAGERLAVDPNLGTKLYFGTRNNGLWVSTNRGTSWSQVSSFPVTSTTSGVGVVFVNFITASGSSGTATPVIYAGVSDTGPSSSTGFSSLYRSTDSGATWTAVPGQPTGNFPMRATLAPDGNLYLAYSNAVGPTGVTAGALYQYALPPSTTPAGNGTWTNITPSGTNVRVSYAQGGFATIASDPEVPGVLMATTLDDYYPAPGDDIYRSTNYGASWVSFNHQGATHNASLSPWLLFGGSTTSTGNWPASLVIDPFNSNHVYYGNGQTLWDTTNAQTSDSGGVVAFNVGALGIEETAVTVLMSPSTGVPLVSGVGDLGGFVHTSLTTSPSGGMIMNPLLSGGTGLDFAQATPSTMVRVGTGSSPYGSYSTNGGSSWTPFGAAAPGTTSGGGAVALAADTSVIVWAPSDVAVVYSSDHGTTWTASTGATAKSGIYADRFNALKFYIYNSSTGTLQISTNGAQSFSNAATGLATGGVLAVSYAAEGDLWLGSSGGLYHSTNSGTSFTKLSNVSSAYGIGFGAAASYSSYPTIFMIGVVSGTTGFFRSTDGGSTWLQMNSTAYQYGYTNTIVGDPKTFARFYLGTNGRGIIYGDSPQ